MRKLSFAFAFLFFLLTFSSSPARANNAPSYIEKFKDIAIREMHRSGIPASITIAQAIHESGWGTGTLAVNSNNYFGIKCKDYWTGPTYYIKDDDLDANGNLIKSCFRAYGQIEDSFIDHSDFLRDNPRYNVLFQKETTDYRGWAEGLQKCGYATDKKYAEKLIANIEKYQLFQYDTTPPPFAAAPAIPITKPTKPASTVAAPTFNIGTYAPGANQANTAPAATAPAITVSPAIDPVPNYSFEEENYEVPQAYEIPNDYVRGSKRTTVEVLNLNVLEEFQEEIIEEQVAPMPVRPAVVSAPVIPAENLPVESPEEAVTNYDYETPEPTPTVPAPAMSAPVNTEPEAIIRMTYNDNKKTTQLSRQPRVENKGRRR